MFGLTPFNRNSVKKNDNEFMSFYNMIDDFFNDSFFPMRSLRNDTFKIDVKENEKEYLIEAEMPGISKNEVNIDYDDNRLLISVKRDEQINEENDDYIHRERRLCSMQRSLYLRDIAGDKITAKLQDGVLKIVAPKKNIGKSRYKIDIE